MSFGGKSFKKGLIKKELQQLTKKSQNEFSSMAAAEKEAIRQKSKTKVFEKPKKKKKPKVEEESTERDDRAVSPSIDLDAEMKGIDFSEPQFPFVADEERQGVIGSAKVASIKSNVDLNVVMKGRKIDDKTEISGAITINSRISQRTSGKSPSAKPSSSAKRAISPKPPVPTQTVQPRPAILPSQNSTMQINLSQRPTPKPIIVTSRPTSKMSGRMSVKSNISHTLKEQKEESVCIQETAEDKPQDYVHVDTPETRPEMEDLCENDDENENEQEDERDDEKDEIEMESSLEVNREPTPVIPTNPSDIIHSEIQALTQSLMGQGSSIMDFLQFNETKKSVDNVAMKSFAEILHPTRQEDNLAVVNSNATTSPWMPKTSETQGRGSPMKTFTDSKRERSRADTIKMTLSTREWPGIICSGGLQHASKTSFTDDEALQAVELPVNVRSEDIINIKGEQTLFHDKLTEQPITGGIVPSDSEITDDVTWLGSWNLDQKVAQDHNIHHFCTMATSMEISPHLHRLTRDSHTPDRLHTARKRFDTKVLTTQSLYVFKEGYTSPEEDKDAEQTDNENYVEERRMSLIANRILTNALMGEPDEIIKKLKAASDQLFLEDKDKELQIEGVKIEMKDDSSRLYWTPAPPKMALAPETIREHLYPDYQGAALLRESLGTDHVALTTLAESDDEEDQEDGMSEPEEHKARSRILDRTYGSMSDLSKVNLADKTTNDDDDDQQLDGNKDEALVRFESLLDKRRQQLKDEKAEKTDEKMEGVGDKDVTGMDSHATPYRRTHSEPMLSFTKEQVQLISNYDISMKELEYQLNAVTVAKAQLDAENEADDETSDHEHLEDHTSMVQEEAQESLYSHSQSPSGDLHSKAHDTESEDIRTETMSVTTVTSKQTGVNVKKHKMSIPRGKAHKKHGKRKTVKDLERQKHIKEFLEQPANPLSRTVSFNNMMSLMKDCEPKLDNQESSLMEKTTSMNDLQDFETLIDGDLIEPIANMYDWTKEHYWYKWFDEVYPPSIVTPEYRYDFLSVTSHRAPTTMSKSSGAVINTAILDTIQVIQPEMSETDNELYQLLLEEIENLTSMIDKTEKKETLAFYLCRRGAIYRKIGELKKAWDDLNRSIELESMLLDAYWHRHLLHLVQNNKKSALDDLTYIIKNNGNQARAYRSRAELYRQQGDATMAIVNYSQAIKLSPNDVETYYQRASMFKMRGDMLLALEDYGVAAKLLPIKTEAMFEIGKYHFNNENWLGAINDFNTILQQDSCDSLAHTYRGRVYNRMGQFNNALRDFSAAIHYDPNNAVALYHRACILRKIDPRRALQDFSVSLLLDDSVDNVNAFLHRGILYTDLKRWEDAIPDFEAALVLNPNLASAHVNIGLIYIIKHSNYQRAIRQFTSAIHVDPTYIRARICRAEAYEKMGMLQEAVMDYTRVIHVRPDLPDYHMARGKILLAQHKLDLASYHVKQAAKLNQGLGASATQQAVVQSFLNNFDVAINVLDRATRVNPSAPLFVLLGKTNMKAKRFADAIGSFKKAIEIMTPWNVRIAMPLDAALVYFLIGICHSELIEYHNALDAFNNAIKVNSEYAEAFYHRGLTKMKLRYTRGIHDFNRALAINPKLFQAFLSRAAYYGMKNRYSKGIMSCNEAIKLQPRSVRAYLYRGALKYHIKAYGLAVKDLTEAVAIDCRCSLAYFNRAVCYHGMRFYQKALMDYSTVMLLENKPNLKVLQNRGLLYLEVNDIENALEDFKAAAKESELDPKIRHALGYCYHKLNRLEEAVAAFNDALNIDPFFVEAYNGRGNALMDYGHEQGNVLGRRDYLKALHINPQCLSARVNLAYNLQVEGKYRDAWDQFSAAIAINSSCQAALEGRAVVNLQMRNTFGALVDMNDAIKISKTAELLNNRGVVHQFMSDYVNAVRDYQSGIRLDPSYALSYYNAGNIYFKQRQFKQALSYYDKALSWTPDDESFVLNRAITKVLLRDSKGAIQDFNKAVELSPYAAHVYFNRGNLYASLRKYKEAEDDYTRALSLCPGDALVYKRRADVLGKQSKRDAAIEDYKKAIIIKTRSTNRRG